LRVRCYGSTSDCHSDRPSSILGTRSMIHQSTRHTMLSGRNLRVGTFRGRAVSSQTAPANGVGAARSTRSSNLRLDESVDSSSCAIGVSGSTSGFHPEGTGSTPVWRSIRLLAQFGRASGLHPACCGFKSLTADSACGSRTYEAHRTRSNWGATFGPKVLRQHGSLSRSRRGFNSR
jgi:hypothetical protein